VSDQDFFFDEEPTGTTTDSKGAKPGKQAASNTPAAPAAAIVPEASGDQSTTWAVAMLIGIIGLLLGAILGFLLGTSLAKSATVPAATAPAATSPAVTAPSADPGTLTTDQVSSGLPAGHPPVSVPTSESVDTTK